MRDGGIDPKREDPQHCVVSLAHNIGVHSAFPGSVDMVMWPLLFLLGDTAQKWVWTSTPDDV